MFPVIWYFLFGSWFKSQLGSLVSGVKGLLRRSVPRFKSQLDSLVSAAKGLLCGLVPISYKRRRGVHIANVVPGPRPRTGFGGGDVEHCPLLWWYAVGADQATKLHVWRLIFHSQCIGNGKRRRLVCPPSCRNRSFLPFKVFVRLIIIFYICLNY